MVARWKITIPELTGTEERAAYIYLPESYEWEPEMRYPVLYMFDGHNVFFDEDATYGKCWGMTEYMDATDTQMLIVGVECNHDPDHGRLKEYSPFDFRSPEFGEITGLGRITMDWLVHTFKPYIDSRYRTIPDREYTFIAGSSMGGLMTLYAVMEYNAYFRGGAALSPSLWTAPKELTRMIQKAKLLPDTVLYMDYGSEELSNHRRMRSQFESIAGQLLRRGVMLNARIVPGGTHCEASWEQQIPFFMNTLLYEP